MRQGTEPTAAFPSLLASVFTVSVATWRGWRLAIRRGAVPARRRGREGEVGPAPISDLLSLWEAEGTRRASPGNTAKEKGPFKITFLTPC